MSCVYVVLPHHQGQLDAVSFELIAAARPLGDVHAVVVSDNHLGEQLFSTLSQAGVSRTIDVHCPDYAARVILPEVDAVSQLAAATPGPIVTAATVDGNEIAGRLAARLGSGVLCDVTAIGPDGTATMSILGDSYQVSAAVGGACPIYTVRPGVTVIDDAATDGELVAVEIGARGGLDVAVTGFTPAAPLERPDLTQAKVVVAGGRGVGSREGFTTLCEPLADVFGGAVGATRDAADDDFYDRTYQIGQTGVTCAPDLYIGLGISGAIQHKAGMQTSRTIVAINNDEEAPIFDICDFGVVGDVHTVVPQLIEQLQAAKGTS
ncbi:electron transfer flavoprotein subunit alpha/FixB family protein [Corynebacterium choanae]|uniref:Electron transfer flavoprotein subunit alpha n=1 Tax=Corynebacterium choanae TaxID=1862358 RepID=A0A3G6J5J0_9CORY|nr:electron transfer flavoprotein subunit alpha/FixB family protein [Corynebacterium choanae]AZA13355.1 Electron transfer flavoprotein subunit alpha [Corynebacterium choanae]